MGCGTAIVLFGDFEGDVGDDCRVPPPVKKEDAPRTILHVDMDAFYVSVEMRRHPELIGQPVVVGGSGSRGVVAAANYEARRYGVFSAMSSSKARGLCPQAVFLDGDHAHYAAVSASVMAIFRDFTPLVEPLALDEAFLDVGGAIHLFGSGREIGWRIKGRIEDDLGLPCSVGVAASKFIAKLASKQAKPVVTPERVLSGEGVSVIEPGEELAFLHPLGVRSLWGVGPATFKKLDRLGMRTVGDLLTLDNETLERAVGRSLGRHLHDLARGIDNRPVETDRQVKSVGREETFSHDIVDSEVLHHELVRLADDVASRLRAQGLAARTVTLKVRFSDFETITRSHTPPAPVSSAPALVRALDPLLATLAISRGIRLIGVSGSGLVQPSEQLSLLDVLGSKQDSTVDDVQRAWAPASTAIDEIRSKFGIQAIGPGSSGISRRGESLATPWGPRAPDSDGEPGDEGSRNPF